MGPEGGADSGFRSGARIARVIRYSTSESATQNRPSILAHETPRNGYGISHDRKHPEMVPSDQTHKLRILGTIAIVADILEETYGPFIPHPNGDALAQLIGTILSQHTSDINTERAYASLRSTFPTWEDVALADPAAVVEAIRSGGLANSKAPRIQDILTEIKEQTGDYRLDVLAEMSVADATRWLVSLHGVGPKTAACVLLFALGKPVMPVDTHVHRIAQRIGFVGPKVNAIQTELVLEELIGDNSQQVYAFHKGLIAHGKTICKARAPRCAECPLKEHCDYYHYHNHYLHRDLQR